ncbi:uncharacterized protein LOC142986293 [Anticarsia gemmatalis]|uniref:uncharacterized protein LOC142986293 n=1 Tax=Anticarsia gemmatalis TaxID=129554 RepID=UPI003F76E17F
MLGVLCCVLFVTSHVCAQSPIMLLVNNKVIPAADNEYYNHYYVVGDSVEVTCAVNTTGCNVNLYYEYAKKLHESFKGVVLESKQGVGMRTNLRLGHKDTSVTCTATCQETRHISVNFVLRRENNNDMIKFKVNNIPVRKNREVDQTIEYSYSVGETINVKFEIAYEDSVLELQWSPNVDENPINFVRYSDTKNEITIMKSPKTSFILTYKINLTRTGKGYTVKLKFSPSHLEYVPLITGLLKTNIIMELYKFEGNQLIYYEYEEGEVVPVKCAVPPYLVAQHSATFHFRNQVSADQKVQEIILTAKDNDTSLECSLGGINLVFSDVKALVLFRKRIDGDSLTMVLVNRVVLPTVWRSSSDLLHPNVYRSAIYEYSAGDDVDLFCVCRDVESGCKVQLSYDYAGKLHDMFKNDGSWSRHGVGVRSTLRAEQSGSFVVCKYFGAHHNATVHVTFKLKEKLNDILSVKLNNITLRGFDVNQPGIVKQCAFLPHEGVTVELTTGGNVAIKRPQVSDGQFKLGNYQNHQSIKLEAASIEKPASISSILYNSTTKQDFNNITIKFIPIPVTLDKICLTMEMPKQNILLKMYELNQKELIYYEYTDGDTLTINCSKHNSYARLSLNGEVTDRYRIMKKNSLLGPANDSTILECLLEEPDQHILRSIHVLLHRRKDGFFDKVDNLIFPCSLIGAAILTALICFLLFKTLNIMQYCSKKQVNTSESLQPNNPERLQPTCPQDDLQAVHYQNINPVRDPPVVNVICRQQSNIRNWRPFRASRVPRINSSRNSEAQYYYVDCQ